MMKQILITVLLFASQRATCADNGLDRLDKVEKSEKGTIYSPIGKRDPFKPPSLDALGKDNSALNPLERFSLEQFQLRAILQGLGRSRAMLEDPEGRTYIIGTGDLIGRERATVSRILNTGVVLTERTFNYLGQESLYEKVLSLPQQREEGVIEDLTPRRKGRGDQGQQQVPQNQNAEGFLPPGFAPPQQADRPIAVAPAAPPPAPLNPAPAAPANNAPANAAPAAGAPAAGAGVPTITNRGNNGGLTY